MLALLQAVRLITPTRAFYTWEEEVSSRFLKRSLEGPARLPNTGASRGRPVDDGLDRSHRGL